jgi:hypothetical protein
MRAALTRWLGAEGDVVGACPYELSLPKQRHSAKVNDKANVAIGLN